MITEVKPFDYGTTQLRTVLIDDEPFFLAIDICRSLNLKDSNVALRKLDADEKLIRKLYVSGQNREVVLVNESGLYHLIFKSTKPQAKLFRKWVTSEVLPQIRKTGSYAKGVTLPTENVKVAAEKQQVLYDLMLLLGNETAISGKSHQTVMRTYSFIFNHL